MFQIVSANKDLLGILIMPPWIACTMAVAAVPISLQLKVAEITIVVNLFIIITCLDSLLSIQVDYLILIMKV